MLEFPSLHLVNEMEDEKIEGLVEPGKLEEVLVQEANLELDVDDEENAAAALEDVEIFGQKRVRSGELDENVDDEKEEALNDLSDSDHEFQEEIVEAEQPVVEQPALGDNDLESAFGEGLEKVEVDDDDDGDGDDDDESSGQV